MTHIYTASNVTPNSIYVSGFLCHICILPPMQNMQVSTYFELEVTLDVKITIWHTFTLPPLLPPTQYASKFIFWIGGNIGCKNNNMTYIYTAFIVTTKSKYARKYIFWIGGNIGCKNSNMTYIYTASIVTTKSNYAKKYIFWSCGNTGGKNNVAPNSEYVSIYLFQIGCNTEGNLNMCNM